MNRKLVIFDGNHLAYRAYYKFTNLKTLDGVKTGVVYGMPYVAESLIRRLSPDKILMVFDGGRSKFRLDLLPTYKARENKLGFDHEDFHRQKDIAKELFIALGIRVSWKKGFEADDLITMITRRYYKRQWDIVIISADKDFNQLIVPAKKGLNGGVSIQGKTKEINYSNIKSELGYNPEQCVDYLSLLGDKSDHIPGYPGIGPVKATQILEKYGNIKSFLNSEDKFGKVDKKELNKIYKLNRKLIDLNFFYRKFLMHEIIPWVDNDIGFDYDKVKSICASNEINSFLKPQFIKTFKNLK